VAPRLASLPAIRQVSRCLCVHLNLPSGWMAAAPRSLPAPAVWSAPVRLARRPTL